MTAPRLDRWGRPNELEIRRWRYDAMAYTRTLLDPSDWSALPEAKETPKHRVTDWPFIQWPLFLESVE